MSNTLPDAAICIIPWPARCKSEIGIIRRRTPRADGPRPSAPSDFEDINQLRDSERFTVDSVAVKSAVT